MLMECPVCQHVVIGANQKFDEQKTLHARTKCSGCGAVFEVMVRMLDAPEKVAAKNKTS